MATTYSKTAIALQGGGALGAYSFGALKYIYESEPDLQLSSISGVSIGAFTAAIVASHPENPIDHLQSFWKDLTVFHSKLLPAEIEKYFAYFGNWSFYLPRQDYYDLPLWTSFYDLSPIKDTLAKYVDTSRIARAEIKLVVTATDIESGEIKSFDNSNPDQPITIDHIIASGSLPPSYPPKRVGNRSYWDGGLFDNTPLSQLLNQISVDDAAATRVIVINLFPNRGSIPKNMINVWDRMIEIQFSNKTKKDVALAQKINKLIAAIERLQGVPAHHTDSLTQLPEFADLAKYKVFDNIIAISNDTPEEVSSSADFSKASIDRRIAAGYHDAKIALTEPPKRAADIVEAITLPGEGHAKWSSKQEKIEETNKKPTNRRALEVDGDYMPISELLAKRRAAATTPVGDWPPSTMLPTAPQSDIVDISVFGPESLRAGSQCLVQVYLHLLDQAAAVLTLAKEVNPEATRRGVKTLATEIARGTPIVVVLEGRGLSVDQGKQDLVWRGIPDACEFTVAAPAGSAGQSFYPRILVLVNSVPIGSVTFALRVTADERLAANEIRGERARRYSYAFLSYASPNRAEVLKRVQGLKAARINFFQDLLTLEPGEHWEKRLYEEIDACDLFLLFWSTEAKASSWVMKEVEHALNRQKKSPDQLPHITPVIIEGPPPPSPPEMLRDIHFNDSLIYVLAAVQAQPARTP